MIAYLCSDGEICYVGKLVMQEKREGFTGTIILLKWEMMRYRAQMAGLA